MAKINHRPEYHFTPPSGWMNDPNGLVFYEGEYHLFYQHIPPGQEGLHWGHAVSTDLTDWIHLPVALTPDPLGDIWSGSAVADHRDRSGFFDGGSGLVAVFTHHLPHSQSQSLAYSRDRGRTWTKYAGNPVLSDTGPDFRDPKVFWHAPTDRWCMIVAAGAEARIYSSPNLTDWSYLSAFPAPEPDWVWECPDLIELDGQWLLSGSFVTPERLGAYGGNTLYWRGSFDGAAFIPRSDNRRLSFGPDDYAAVSWDEAPAGRRVVIGWMSRWAYAQAVPTKDQGFCGVMTLPRVLSWKDGTLRQHPPRELSARRGASAGFDQTELSLPGDACEIEAEIDISALRSPEVGFALGDGAQEAAQIVYQPASQTLCLRRTQTDRTTFHSDFAAEFCGPLAIEDGLLTLRIFVDRCSVEVFAQDGTLYGAALLFPTEGLRSLCFFGAGAQIRRGIVYDYTHL